MILYAQLFDVWQGSDNMDREYNNFYDLEVNDLTGISQKKYMIDIYETCHISINDISGILKLSPAKIEDIIKLFSNLKKGSVSAEEFKILEIVPDEEFDEFLNDLKVNTLIECANYFLEKDFYFKLSRCIEKIEYDDIKIWYQNNVDNIDKKIKENMKESSLLYIFNNLEQKEFDCFFKDEYLSILKDAPANAYLVLLNKVDISNNPSQIKLFYEAFSKYNNLEQLKIIELITDLEWDISIIKKLRNMINKNNCSELSLDILNTTQKRFGKIYDIIKQSSYYMKNQIENTKIGQILLEISNCNSEVYNLLEKDKDYFVEMMKLYEICQDYARNSIVNALYPLEKLQDKINYIEKDKYNILINALSDYSKEEMMEHFSKDRFYRFNILTENNFSHCCMHTPIYGFSSGVTSKNIVHLSAMTDDMCYYSKAKLIKDVYEKPTYLLDIDDINMVAYNSERFNHVIMEPKDINGNLLKPDCLICLDEVTDKQMKKAEDEDLKILVLKRNKYTIEINGMEHYAYYPKHI